MTDTLTLVHEFTRSHKTTVENEDDTTSYVDVHSHLDQLRHAITANRGTGGSGSLAKSPISLKAVDLWQEIANRTLDHWPGYGRPHLANTPLPRRVQQWAAVAVNSNDDYDEQLLNQYLTRWIGQIESLFEPSVDLAAPCPDCGESFIWNHDGVENVKKRTLAYNKHRAWCNNCGQAWDGKGAMANLARILHDDRPVDGGASMKYVSTSSAG